jgi:hypothetical protein
MVVVADATLESRRMSGRLEPTHQPGAGAGGQYVVDGLGGYRAELLGHPQPGKAHLVAEIR